MDPASLPGELSLESGSLATIQPTNGKSSATSRTLLRTFRINSPWTVMPATIGISFSLQASLEYASAVSAGTVTVSDAGVPEPRMIFSQLLRLGRDLGE